ncbi:hypothetical protein SDC9_209061 [bioreactor metagenome]|uniref:Uncharacterized protein n=1 Tax=bioreactor metagenome TaxID=1076179 RepID=A0A645JC82_9ZZZZ
MKQQGFSAVKHGKRDIDLILLRYALNQCAVLFDRLAIIIAKKYSNHSIRLSFAQMKCKSFICIG